MGASEKQQSDSTAALQLQTAAVQAGSTGPTPPDGCAADQAAAPMEVDTIQAAVSEATVQAEQQQQQQQQQLQQQRGKGTPSKKKGQKGKRKG